MTIKLIPSIINLTNSAIGAALMTIPFCFYECGVVLSSVLVVGISLLTVVASEFLLASGLHHRKMSYELLCSSSLGRVGKAVLELNMIGMMYGSCVAYAILIGDLGCGLAGGLLGLGGGGLLRGLLALGAAAAVLPLCLRRDLGSLAVASGGSLLFYGLLVAHLALVGPDGAASLPSVADLRWWRPMGVWKVVPIISFGFTIQTQVFPVFAAMRDPRSDHMRIVVRTATALVCLCYLLVGLSGYWRFSERSPRVSPDLLSMYAPSLLSTVMRAGFLCSVAVSYPLSVFPMRASLYSLLCVRSTQHEPDPLLPEAPTEAIPEPIFRRITVAIVASSFLLGLLLSNIDIVLSLTGSLSGSVVLFILPALIRLRSRPHAPRQWLAYSVLLFGLGILVLSFLAGPWTPTTVNISIPPPSPSSQTLTLARSESHPI